jgi:DegV family protein with EDD domain
MAEAGIDAKTIVETIEDARSKVRASFVVDKLTYLHRGGRCSAVTALIGNALALKPEITVVNGKMGVAKKYRGKQGAVIHKYADDLREHLLASDPRRVYITHSGVSADVLNTIYSLVKELNYFENIEITRAGGVISSHCGPNTLGILYYEK